MSRDVGVGQLVQELEQRGDRLPFEIGAFVALEACEGLLQESVKLKADDVRVTLEGSVIVADSAERAEPDEAVRSLVSVLAQLLVAAGPGVPPYLLQLVKDTTTGQRPPRDLRHLHDAIEASLIPINRGASRRVLARLVRESDRPPAPEAPEIDPHELDAELDELLRDPVSRTLEPTQAKPSLQEEEDEEPITERIRIPRSVMETTDTDTGAATAPDSVTATVTVAEAAPVSFPPPVPDPQPETVRIPPSEPALQSASVPIPDLKPPRAPDTAATAPAIQKHPRQPGPEPITATIRKWARKEESATESESVAAAESVPESVPESESAAESVAAAESVPESVPESESESAAVTESVSAAVIESATVSVSAPEPATESATLTESVSVSEAATDTAAAIEPAAVTDAAPLPAYDRSSLPTPQPPKRRGGWGVLLFAAALGLGAYALVTSGTLDALLQRAAPVATPAPTGRISVTVTPADAQIFVFVGRGPAVATDLPVDGANEFIVFDRGLRPSRAAVPKGATWTTTESGPLYELALQAQPVTAPTDVLDLGSPQTEPASAEMGSSGTIRIITNPQGAKVYRFVGVGPTAQIPAASIHEGQEILVYHPAHETRRAVIGPSDWQPTETENSYGATLEIQLPALPASAATTETPEN